MEKKPKPGQEGTDTGLKGGLKNGMQVLFLPMFRSGAAEKKIKRQGV